MSKFPLIAPDASPTEQQVFDVCAGWLLAQKEPCTKELTYDDEGELISGDYCCYRSADGKNACAVGIFMTDELAALVEGAGENAVDDVVDLFPSKVPSWFVTHMELLQKLQDVHDCGDLNRWGRLRNLAIERGLTFRFAESEGQQ